MIGAQGIGKSTFVAHLFPDKFRREFFTDNFSFADDDKARIEALLGFAIVEVSELAGMRRADLEALKAFVSRDTDNKRLAYARNQITIPRRCVFVGTTNSQTPLPSGDENRRFVPIRLLGGDAAFIREYMNENRERLWAEARDKYILRNQEARLPEQPESGATPSSEHGKA